MIRSLKTLSVGLTCAAITAATMGQTPQPTRSAQQPVQPDARATQSPTFMEGEFAMFFQDEPSGYFHNARWACVNHHPSLAATNLRKAAATYLERGAAWTGHKLESCVANTVYGTRFLAGKLMAGAGWTVDEVGKAIDALGKGIDTAGKWVASPRTPDREPKQEPKP